MQLKHIKLNRFLILLFSLVLIFALKPLSLANAQSDLPEGAGLTISPLVFELNADPKDSLTNQIKIYNPTSNSANVSIGVEDFKPVGDQGDVVLSEPTVNDFTYSIASWTQIVPSTFTLEPGKQQIVTYKINVPATAEPGGHYGSIVATISGGQSNVSGSSVGSKRGALILLRVSGDIKESLIVDNFETKSFLQEGPVDFTLKFKNTGNVHLKPTGFITITNMFGKKVAEIEIPQKNVIPDAVRDVSTSWKADKLFGQYTATVVANYGNTSQQVVTESLAFTVFPLKKALILFAILALVGLVLFLGRKRIGKALKVLLGK
ncbi:MAG: hypothetical protein Fur003_2970 [Candidatus Dojkabacteria bacterium]